MHAEKKKNAEVKKSAKALPRTPNVQGQKRRIAEKQVNILPRGRTAASRAYTLSDRREPSAESSDGNKTAASERKTAALFTQDIEKFPHRNLIECKTKQKHRLNPTRSPIGFLKTVG